MMGEAIDLSGRDQAWAALRINRETIETLGPPGLLISEAEVLAKYGPEMIHEAQAICDALVPLLTSRSA